MSALPHSPPPESDLRRDFSVRAEEFRHRDFRVEVLLPLSSEDLIDVSAFNVDERLPYWAELWPSARALARHLLEHSVVEGRWIELGAGVALPSLALHARGATVVASDYYPEALRFAEVNALRNGLPPLPTRLLDWREAPAGLAPFDHAVAADVVYERRNVDALLQLLPLLIRPGGRLVIADPGRVYHPELTGGLASAGWSTEAEELREETDAEGHTSRIRIHTLCAPL